MRPGDKPSPPKCSLASVIPTTMDKEAVKRRAWLQDGHLVVTDEEWQRLDWVKRRMVVELGNYLFGERK